MTEVRLSGSARAAIRRILADSEREYGAVGRLRYAALIETALRDLTKDPLRPSARRDVVDGHTLLTYHLSLSRHRVPDPPGRVQDPPHALVYEVADDGTVDIYGVIHERMHPSRVLRQLRNAGMMPRGGTRST